MIQFWWRSGSRFGSGSPKSEIWILRIGGGLCSLGASSLFVRSDFVRSGWSLKSVRTLFHVFTFFVHNHKKSQNNLASAASPPLTAGNNYATKSPLRGMPRIYPQNCPFPFDDPHLHLIHPSLDRPHSLPQTAFRSNQPFCQSTPSGQTDS